MSDADMWQHRKNVEAAWHPVQLLPRWLLMHLLLDGGRSAFVPMNVPLCAFMLMANGTPQVLAAQWLNQTYNMVNNYVNRSGATVEWAALLQSYALAVTASCSIAVGAGRLMKAVPSLQVMGPFVPYLAVISAGTANVAIADEDGRELGMSKAAGQMGVLQTVLSRSCFLPIAPMVMPIVGMKMIGSVAPALTAGAAGVVVEILLITGCISGMLPVALALLPQKMEIPVSKLEPEYQNLKVGEVQSCETCAEGIVEDASLLQSKRSKGPHVESDDKISYSDNKNPWAQRAKKRFNHHRHQHEKVVDDTDYRRDCNDAHEQVKDLSLKQRCPGLKSMTFAEANCRKAESSYGTFSNQLQPEKIQWAWDLGFFMLYF
eukprot:Skav210404  [mRNA]  locus=scaffold1416:271903:284314:- [translate_table: standard]